MTLWPHNLGLSQLTTIDMTQCFPQVQKERGGRYNFSVRSKQIKHSNDNIKGNQITNGGGGGGGGTLVPLFGGNTDDRTIQIIV